MSMDVWTEKWPCPHCGGKVESYYISDCMSTASGTDCENEGKYQCSLTLAWESAKERRARERVVS